MNGKGTTGKSVTEQMQAVYGVSMDSLNLMTSSELLSHALGKDLAAYLLNGGFLTHSLTMSGLLILNPMDAPVEEELKKYLPENPAPISLSDIENAYKSMMARRPVLKSMLAEAKAKAAVSVDTPKRSSDDIQKEITSLSKKIAAEESLTSGYPKYLQEVEKLKQNIAESEAKSMMASNPFRNASKNWQRKIFKLPMNALLTSAPTSKSPKTILQVWKRL